MMREQTLSTGLIIRQNITAAVRAVFFQTDYEEFLYATHGGTLFLIRVRGRDYAITCGHVFGDFPTGRLFITQDKIGKKGTPPAPILGLRYPSSPTGDAQGGDVIDICVIEFIEDLPSDFFRDSAYIIDPATVTSGQKGHQLLIAGVLKEKSTIVPPDIDMGYCQLQATDVGTSESDPLLRKAIALYLQPQFTSVTGISGAPVFDVTANALCGMVMRAGMNAQGQCNFHFMDIADIVHLVELVSDGKTHTNYKKVRGRIATTSNSSD